MFDVNALFQLILDIISIPSAQHGSINHQSIFNFAHCHAWRAIIGFASPHTVITRLEISPLWHVDGGQQEKQQQAIPGRDSD